MSAKYVAKFGGTSVQTAAAIQQVAKIVCANADIQVVVVSAVGGITHLLSEFCHAQPKNRAPYRKRIVEIHLALFKELNLGIESIVLNKLEQLDVFEGKKVLSLQDIDSILALGEDISSQIVLHHLLQHGINIEFLDARQCIYTNHHHGKAEPILEDIKKVNFPTKRIITQGFVGATKHGLTTTLGRGGSDYSAALIGEAINADMVLIYTDVPGVFTIDPNFIHSGQCIEEITFHEMAEMANFGAKILHPATLEPCVRAQIPIKILSTFEPEKPGTKVITEKRAIPKQPLVRAITVRHGQRLVSIKSLKMLNAYGFLANIFSILAQHKISVDLITTSEVSVALTIDSSSLENHPKNPFAYDSVLVQDLEQFAELLFENDLSLLAIIGYGLTIPGVIQSILSSIEKYKIRLVCYGASNSSIGILVAEQDVQDVARLLHHQLLECRHV
jgi:aspartate kinase